MIQNNAKSLKQGQWFRSMEWTKLERLPKSELSFAKLRPSYLNTSILELISVNDLLELGQIFSLSF